MVSLSLSLQFYKITFFPAVKHELECGSVRTSDRMARRSFVIAFGQRWLKWATFYMLPLTEAIALALTVIHGCAAVAEIMLGAGWADAGGFLQPAGVLRRTTIHRDRQAGQADSVPRGPTSLTRVPRLVAGFGRQIMELR